MTKRYNVHACCIATTNELDGYDASVMSISGDKLKRTGYDLETEMRDYMFDCATLQEAIELTVKLLGIVTMPALIVSEPEEVDN